MYVYMCEYWRSFSVCCVPRRKETAQKQHSLRLLTYNNWKGYARLLMQGPFQSKTTQTLYLLICVSLFGMRAAYARTIATIFIRVLWRARLGRVREGHQEPLQRGAAHRAVLSSLENAAEDAQDHEDLAPPRSHSPSYIHTHCTTKHRFTTT